EEGEVDLINLKDQALNTVFACVRIFVTRISHYIGQLAQVGLLTTTDGKFAFRTSYCVQISCRKGMQTQRSECAGVLVLLLLSFILFLCLLYNRSTHNFCRDTPLHRAAWRNQKEVIFHNFLV